MKKLLIILLGIFSLVFSVYAGEYTGDLDTGLNTGLGGVVIKSPTATPGAGSYKNSVQVQLSAEGSVYMCYTQDDSSPQCNWDTLTCSVGSRYSSKITLTSTTTIKARSCYPGGETSGVSSFKYIVTHSSSGGGGGSPSVCQVSHLECIDGRYYRKTGVSCNGGLLGEACTIGGNGGGIALTGLLEDIWLSDIRDNTYPLATQKQKLIIDKLLELVKAEVDLDLELARMSQYVNQEKNKYLRLFNDILVNILQYTRTKDNSYKETGLALIAKLSSYRTNFQNAKLKYVVVVNGVFRPVSKKYGSIFVQIENILFTKIDSLKAEGIITQTQYDEFVLSYNKFVFAVLMWKLEKSPEAKTMGMAAIKIILTYYYM